MRIQDFGKTSKMKHFTIIINFFKTYTNVAELHILDNCGNTG